MQWLAQAPANIALIKYMGKKDKENNIPDNASLSYTLNNLLSTVVLEKTAGKIDSWEPLLTPGAEELHLSKAGQSRFLNHLARIKSYFNYSGAFIVRSTNNFPQGSGLASSASSFAALTKCASLALSELSNRPLPSIEEQAKLSMMGSGSSCRSFFSPWALWREDKVECIDLPYNNLIHKVIIVSHEEKAVSSSEAHQRVKTSPFYEGRSQRAEENLSALLQAFDNKDWEAIYHICWKEFQDMHQLFSSAQEPFSYIGEPSRALLHQLQELWRIHKDGPIVTMDAGPNIHVLYRPDQVDMAQEFKQRFLVGNYDVL